ncbi:uncharacterized protein LOC135148446 [Daucus carota subsp. sativus]|uniref:uncharacterized protein LOC135148446 n=1 Tax=Daucus carota subsp. sativus TaxID=79200 RepID=UPI003083954A
MECDPGGFGLGDDFDEMIRNSYKNDIDTSGKNQMTKDAINFYRLVEEGKQPLYPGSKTFTRLGFVVKLYMLKCTCGFTESAFSAILELIKEAFPESNLPPSFSAAKGMIKELGLDYEKIHACPNDCMLYWAKNKDENICKVCGVSRWKAVDNDKTDILEKDDRKKYKVPAKVPGNEIDVYLHPLTAELKELWEIGIETYDAHFNNTFTLHASLLWTISDFPGYGVLSGWSTKGYLGCPECHYETSSTYLKHSRKVCYMSHRKFLPPDHKFRLDTKRFNGEVETNLCPEPLSGNFIIKLLGKFRNNFGKMKEKNIIDKILGTLLNIGGRTNDHLNARLDLQEMGIRKILHPVKSADNSHFEIMAACFDMTKKEKEDFCSVQMNARLPYGCASNISRCVQLNERKISGYKSHDAHFILQYLLQFAAIKTLKPDVAIPLIRLGSFFRGICGKVIQLEDVEKLQNEIIEILCQLETIFPPAFFDIMVHLPIHLCKEIEFGGPVHLRWMFGIERYLSKLKSYVRNRSKPEGCIAEGYMVEECLTFCSRFLTDDSKNKMNYVNSNVGIYIGSRRNKDGKPIHLAEKIWINAHRYVLFNSGNMEIEQLIGNVEHRSLYDNQVKSKLYKREREHTKEFYNWLKDEVQKKEECSPELLALSKGPQRAARKFSGYIINGFRFHTKQRDGKCTTQNSGVYLTAHTTSFTSTKDKNPIVADVSYYKAIEEIIEIDYWGSLSLHKYNKFSTFKIVSEKNLYFVVKKLPRDYNDVEDESDPLEEVSGPTVQQELIFSVNTLPDDDSWYRDDVPNRQIPVTPSEMEENDEICE